MKFEEADRLKSLPPYLFAEIDKIIQQKKEKGEDVISLGIGDPDIPVATEIIENLCKEARNPETHAYPSSYGLKKFRQAVSNFYNKRFGVVLDPDTEVIPLWGSKEGIANIAYTFINPGDYSLVPDPSYLVYKIGTMFAGGIPYTLPLKKENNFLIDYNGIKSSIASKVKLLYLNYPNNPTTATCDLEFFKKTRDFAEKYNIMVCHDNAYSDVYFDPNNKPGSFLSVNGAKELGIEFNSLSKTFNMTGWRIGYAVGNKNIITSLGKYKTNVDSGIFDAIQYASVEALNNYEKIVQSNISIYKRRRKIIFNVFDKIGMNYFKSNATIYVWSIVPKGYTSKTFAELLLNRANVVVTPGSSFGNSGEGYFRISITLADSRLEEALERIKKVL
jgi:LL-diaminopimelate aminotransferase